MMRRVTLTLLAFVLLLAACTPGPSAGPTAKEQLPNLSGSYRQYEGEELWKQGSAAAVLGLMFAGQPELAPLAATIATVGACAQEKGVANWRAYVRQDDVTAAGVVLVASKNGMTNPRVLFECGLDTIAGKSQSGISFCSNRYEYDLGGDTFYVLYAASQPRVCDDFCAALTNCPR